MLSRLVVGCCRNKISRRIDRHRQWLLPLFSFCFCVKASHRCCQKKSEFITWLSHTYNYIKIPLVCMTDLNHHVACALGGGGDRGSTQLIPFMFAFCQVARRLNLVYVAFACVRFPSSQFLYCFVCAIINCFIIKWLATDFFRFWLNNYGNLCKIHLLLALLPPLLMPQFFLMLLLLLTKQFILNDVSLHLFSISGV